MPLDPNIPDSVGFPVSTGVGTNTRVASGSALEGALFYLFREITFNRILVEGTAASGSPTICLAMYQFTSGVMNDGTSVVPRTVLIQNQAVVGTGLNTFTVPETTMVIGFYYVLVGRDGGTSWTFRGHSSSSLMPWHGPGLPAPAFPLLFSVATPATPPTTLDLTAIASSIGNQAIVHRFLKV